MTDETLALLTELGYPLTAEALRRRQKGNTMPTLHPHPEDLDLDDLEPMTLCDRCGDEVPVSDTSAGLPHWHEWPEATLCPDCWADTDIEEIDRMREDLLP